MVEKRRSLESVKEEALVCNGGQSVASNVEWQNLVFAMVVVMLLQPLYK